MSPRWHSTEESGDPHQFVPLYEEMLHVVYQKACHGKKGDCTQKRGCTHEGNPDYPENTVQKTILFQESVLWLKHRRGSGEKGEVQLLCQETRERRQGRQVQQDQWEAAMNTMVGNS